jgi:hypothetical protein
MIISPEVSPPFIKLQRIQRCKELQWLQRPQELLQLEELLEPL